MSNKKSKKKKNTNKKLVKDVTTSTEKVVTEEVNTETQGDNEMPKNDPAQDAQNPPGNLSHDFENFTFDSLEIAEVFWQTNQPGDNIPWRKINEGQAMNLKTGTMHTFIHNTVVWQKI